MEGWERTGREGSVLESKKSIDVKNVPEKIKTLKNVKKREKKIKIVCKR